MDPCLKLLDGKRAFPSGWLGCSQDAAPPSFSDDAALEVSFIDVLGPDGEFVGCTTPP